MLLPLTCNWESRAGGLVCRRCGQPLGLHETAALARPCPALVAPSDSILAYPVPRGLLAGDGAAASPSKLSTWQPRAAAEDLARTIAVTRLADSVDAVHRLVSHCQRQGVAVCVLAPPQDYQPQGRELVLTTSRGHGRGPLPWPAEMNAAVTRLLGGSSPRFDRLVLVDSQLQMGSMFFAGLVAAERQTGASIVSPADDPGTHLPQPRFEPAGACALPCVSIHRRVFDAVGALDLAAFGELPREALFDLCLRARQRGLTIVRTWAAGATQPLSRSAPGNIADHNGNAAHRPALEAMTRKWGPRWADLLASADIVLPCVVYTCREDAPDPVTIPSGWRFVNFARRAPRSSEVWESRRQQKSPAWYRRHPDELFPQAQATLWVEPTVWYLADWPSLAWHLGSFCLASYAHADHVLLRRHDHPQFAALQRACRRRPRSSIRKVAAELGLEVGTIRDSLPQHAWLEHPP